MLAVAALGIATVMALGEAAATGGRREAVGGWMPPLGIALWLDGPALFLLAVTGAVGVAISAYAFAYLRGEPQVAAAFWPLWFCCWLGMNAIYVSGDLFNVYVGLEILGLSAAALVSLAGGEARVAAIRYVLISLLGSLLYLLGVALVYAELGVVDIGQVAATATPTPPLVTALVVMTVGLALKTALVPLHFWLPAAHARAIAPASAILSALVVKASFFVVLRVWWSALPGVIEVAFANVIGGLGALAIVWGSVQALRQDRLKMLIAYSTVAQIGYLFLALPLALAPGGDGALDGALLFLLAHACAKAAMFLAAGAIVHATGDDRLATLRGLGVRLPIVMLALGVAGISLIGLPPTGGFLAKWLLLVAAVRTGHVVLALVIVAGSLLAAAYVVRPLALALRERPRGCEVGRLPVPVAMQLAALVLALAGVALGLGARVPLGWLAIGEGA
jgi:multicomponent Na+:H+ antiporter subunit D